MTVTVSKPTKFSTPQNQNTAAPGNKAKHIFTTNAAFFDELLFILTNERSCLENSTYFNLMTTETLSSYTKYVC